MSEYFEIAYAAAAKRLCFFTGTGFSKAVTENDAPSWKELLEELCDDHCEGDALKSMLFPSKGAPPLQLEEAAQVVELQLASKEVSAREEIAKNVSNLKVRGKLKHTKAFLKNRSYRVITTNYDKLAEELAEDDCQSLCPGLPVPRSNSRVKVFHVHGSIDFADGMVVTSNDYFRFMNSESYFSKKMSTVLHENTVVILGYSLGDTNLKAILNDYSGFWRNHSVGSSIFFVSRSPIPQPIADYYAACYGIRVLDETEVEDFFKEVERQYDRAELVLDQSLKDLNSVLFGKKKFKDSFLKLHDSFYQIISAIGAAGHSLDSPPVVKLFGKIIARKRQLCGEPGAWDQYVHLASWLAHIGALIEIEDRSIEDVYLEAVKYSMSKMSQTYLLGYSWHAYTKWETKWKSIQASNRTLIRKFIAANLDDPDAKRIVELG